MSPCSRISKPGGTLRDGSFRNVREFGKRVLQIRVSFQLNETLVWSLSSWSTFAIASIASVNDIHAFNDASNGSKAWFDKNGEHQTRALSMPIEDHDETCALLTLLVQESVSLFSRIDKDLRSSAIGTGRGKDDRPSLVGDFDGVVGQRGGPPFGLYRGVPVNTKLYHKARQHSEYATLIPEPKVC